MNFTSGQILENVSLYEYLRNIHGNELCTRFKDYARCNKKLAALVQSRIFLVNCRTYGVIPNCISNTSKNMKKLFNLNIKLDSNKDSKLMEICRNLHNKLLNLLIMEKYILISKHRKYLNSCRERIVGSVDFNISNSFLASQDVVYENITKKLRENHNNKLNGLKKVMFERLKVNVNKKWFVNHTNVVFTEEMSWLLSLGKKFALPYRKNDFPLLNVIADGEYCIQLINNTEKQKVARGNFCSVLSEFYRNFRNKDTDKFILKLYDETIKFLAQHKDIIITQSDKGGVTVVMYKKDYIHKLQDLLQDRNTYRLLRKDTTQCNQTKNKSFVKHLRF